MSSHNYDRALNAFRPSVYSTGIQGLQAYTPAWMQGSDYGSPNYGSWEDWTPAGLVYGWMTGKTFSTDFNKDVSATASGVVDTVKSGYAAYAKAQADAEAERIAAEKKREEEAAEHRRAAMITAACVLATGIGGFVVYRQYKKTGHLPWPKRGLAHV